MKKRGIEVLGSMQDVRDVLTPLRKKLMVFYSGEEIMSTESKNMPSEKLQKIRYYCGRMSIKYDETNLDESLKRFLDEKVVEETRRTFERSILVYPTIKLNDLDLGIMIATLEDITPDYFVCFPDQEIEENSQILAREYQHLKNRLVF